MSQLSDELLLAYIDGQLGAPQAQSVERMVGSSEELRARVERLKTTQGYLIQTFETLASRTRAAAARAPAGASRARQARAGKGRRSGGSAGDGVRHDNGGAAAARAPSRQRSTGKVLLWAAVLLVVAAILGYGAGKWMRVNSNAAVHKIDERVPALANRWADDVARLHSHFTAASVAADPESQTNRDLVELQLQRIVNQPVRVPSFSEHDLSFRRGQVLTYRGSRMMQLSYVGEKEELLALYVMAGGPASSPSAGASRDVTTVNWGKDGVRYVLAGDQPENSLRALAAVATAQLNGQ